MITWKDINKNNFGEYFFDARGTKPKPGQVLARYTASADFVAGEEKRDIIRLLKTDMGKEASQIMRRVHGAKEPWCYRVPRQMAEDLLDGMPEAEVEQKPYEMVIEFLFWTQMECVPPHDHHWHTLNVLKFDPETGDYISKSTV